MKAATAEAVAQRGEEDISIHAAREGGDLPKEYIENIKKISIHAAREGGDQSISKTAH